MFVKIIRTYSFKDKDPVCDEIATLVDDAGLRGKKNVAKIALLATLATGTVDALLYGETKKPRNSTIMAIATSLGYERTWKRAGNKWSLEEELAKAKEFIKAQNKLRKKMQDDAPKKKRKPRKPPLRARRRKGKPYLRLVA